MAWGLTLERHLLCRFLSDLKIWISTTTLAPKDEVSEGPNFTRAPLLIDWVLWWQGPVPLQSVLWGFRLVLPGSSKDIVSYVEQKAAEIPNTFSGFTEGRMAQWLEVELADGQPQLVCCEVSWDSSGPLASEQNSSFFMCTDAWRWGSVCKNSQIIHSYLHI